MGSCGTLFEGIPRIDATAIDLCPQAGNPNVLQADFLQLPLGEPGSEPLIEPSERHIGGALCRLPAESYDALALSLVLSYLPTPRQRGAMIRKARQLLPTPDPPTPLDGGGDASKRNIRRGLLLVVDTFSVDRKGATKNSEYLRNWIEEIEKRGFVFLRHKVLQRSHALAFATSHLGGITHPTSGEPPELRMRREKRSVE